MKKERNPLLAALAVPLVLISSLSLAACGGSSEDPFKPNPNPTPNPQPTTAARCFNNTLNYTVGNRLEITYRDYSQDENLQETRLVRTVTSNSASFNSQTGLTLINEKRNSVNTTLPGAWSSEQLTYVLGPITANGIVSTLGAEMLAVNNRNERLLESEILFVPAIADQRRTLESGKSLTTRLVGTQQLFRAATNTQPQVNETTQFNRSLQITYVGDEDIRVGSQNIKACIFKTAEANQPDSSEWVYGGLSLRKEVNGLLREQVTAISSPF